MGRPTTIRDERILEAARALFLEKGIRATTAEVARRCGIAEGSIFKRFPTKHDLFAAAMHEGDLEPPPFLRGLAERVGKGDLRAHLGELGLEAIAFFRQHMPLMMMAWSNPARARASLFDQPNPPPLRGLKAFAGYFEAEMRKGRLRRHDPEILARVFLGSLQAYVFFELLLKAQDELPLPAESYVRGLVQLLWEGGGPLPSGKRTRD